MGIAADLDSFGNTPRPMEDAAPKQFVLFVQPEPMRRIRFMELYRNGFVTQWVQDVAEAGRFTAKVFDVVVVDFDHQPEQALRFCRDTKRLYPHRAVVALGAATLSPESGLDGVVSLDASAGELVRVLRGLRCSNTGTQSCPATL